MFVFGKWEEIILELYNFKISNYYEKKIFIVCFFICVYFVWICIGCLWCDELDFGWLYFVDFFGLYVCGVCFRGGLVVG